MPKRLILGLLWIYAAWTSGSFLDMTLGTGSVIGPLAAAMAAVLAVATLWRTRPNANA